MAVASEALTDFIEFAQCELDSPLESPYFDQPLGRRLGSEHYRATVEAFAREMQLGSYHHAVDTVVESPGITGARNLARVCTGIRRNWRHPRRFTRPWHKPYSRRDRMFVVKYLGREEVVARAANFVDDLFSDAMHRSSKRIWCEKTPHNFLHFRQLDELFPDAVHVHMKRDPRAVAWSYSKEPWAPRDLRMAAELNLQIYKAWLDRDFRPQSYLEVRLEDLASDPQATLEPVAEALGIAADFAGAQMLDPESVNNWQDEMGVAERELVEEILGDAITEMGY